MAAELAAAPPAPSPALAALEARLTAVEAALKELRDSRRLGWKAIAAGLRCDEKTARTYAGRREDPLAVRRDAAGQVWIWESALRDWASRNDVPYQSARRIRELEREVERLRAALTAIASGQPAPPEAAREATTGVIRRSAQNSRPLPPNDEKPLETAAE